MPGMTVAFIALAVSLGLPVLGLLGALWSGRSYAIVRVRGPSMEPSFHDGDRVLVRRGVPPAVGAVVVVEQPSGTGWSQPPLPPRAGRAATGRRTWIIKRVAAVPGDQVPRHRVAALAEVAEERVPPGRLVLLGDNSAVSYDSRRFGYYPADRVLGTVARPIT